MNSDELEVIQNLMEAYSTHYVVIQTKYTTHYIEKMMPSNKDRGTVKWIAETKVEAFDNQKDIEARKSHIDNADLFPRYYFKLSSFIIEFGCWLKARDLLITSIKAERV